MRYIVHCYRCCCCCCSAYLSSCHRTASDANLLDDPHTFHYQDYFVIGGIRTCLGVSDDPKFLLISSNSCALNLLLVRSHQAEIIIVKRLIQERNSVTRVRVEPRSFDQGCRKNDAFTYSATLLPARVVSFQVTMALTVRDFWNIKYYLTFFRTDNKRGNQIFNCCINFDSIKATRLGF